MISLTDEQLALRDAGRTRAFFESLSRALRDVQDHWWCTASELVTELLPLLAVSQGSEEMRECVATQLGCCRKCTRQYHAAVDTWCRASHVSEADKISMRESLREWDAERVLPHLAGNVRNWRNSQALAAANACAQSQVSQFREACERDFEELLLDGRLTMRQDVSEAIDKMFAVLNPLAERERENEVLPCDPYGMCLPGVSVLCFHRSPAVRGWARRCSRRHASHASDESGDDDDQDFVAALPQGLLVLLSACIGRLETGVAYGDEADIVDLTDDVEIIPWTDLSACSLETVWQSMAIVLPSINSLGIMRWILLRHTTFLSFIVHILCESQDEIVQCASSLLAHALTVLGSRFWSPMVAVSPVSVVENVIGLYLSDAACDEAKERALTIFAPLVRSLSSSSRTDAISVVSKSCDVLFEASILSNSVHFSPFRHRRSPAMKATDIQDEEMKSMARAARKALAELIFVCYERHPYVVSTFDASQTADLISVMLTESGKTSPWAAHLLRAILKFDAVNVLRVLTNFEVSSLALDACPSHSVAVASAAGVMSEAGRLAKCSSIEADDLEANEVDDGDQSTMLATDCDSLFVNGTFHWCDRVWEHVLKGKFRVLSIGSMRDQSAWPECDVLLDVHALIGMLDVPACDLTVDVARQRLQIFSTDAGSGSTTSTKDADLQCASVDFAFATLIEAVTQQLNRVRQNARLNLKGEPWMRLLPQAAGHLMASTSKSIRTQTFQLLKQLSTVPNSIGGPDNGSFANVIVMRNLLDTQGVGADILRGTGDAASLLSVYGPQRAFRCYLHMIRWAEQLLTSGTDAVVEFLQENGQEQLSCMVEQFIAAWTDQSKERPHLYAEAMSRFLTTLGAIWRYLINSRTSSSELGKHKELLDVLFLLKSCDDATVQAKWAGLVAKVVTRHGLPSDQRDQLTQLLQSSADSPSSLFAGPSKILCDALKLPPVVFPRPAQIKVVNIDAVARTIPIPVPVPSSYTSGLSGNGVFSWNAARRGEASTKFPSVPAVPSDVGKKSSEQSRLQSIQRRLSIPTRNSGQQASAEEMFGNRRITAILGRRQHTSARRRAGLVVAKQRRPKVVDKGPSKMELLVASHKAAREAKLKEANGRQDERLASEVKSRSSVFDVVKPNSGLVFLEPSTPRDSSETVDLGKRMAAQQGSDSRVRREQNIISEADARAAHRAAAKKAAILARRDLRRRDIESFHGLVVNCEISSILDGKKARVLPQLRPERFRTAEEYVQYWEAMLFEELRAELRQALEHEGSVAKMQNNNFAGEDTATKWSCRTPFEVSKPAVLDSSGCFKLLVVRYCGGGSLRDSAGPPLVGGNKDDCSAAAVSSGDLLRVQMAKRARGHVLGSHASRDVAVFLGYVSRVDNEGRDVLVTLKVRFPPGVPEPGPDRAIGLSKLMTMVTHNRQMEALWRVNQLSEGFLLLLLHPKGYWKQLWRTASQKAPLAPTSSARSTTLDQLVREGLNNSQIDVIRETLRITESSPTSDDASGVTLLQGPPGTGKTSTVLAILSVLLAKSLAPGAQRPQPQERAFRCTSGEKLPVTVAPFRILVCAPSNAAVDELLLRVMGSGLMTPSGSHACPRVLRIGKGSKDERVAAVTVSELVERASDFIWSDGPGRKKEARSPEEAALFQEQESLRREIRELSAEIGKTHTLRKEGREAFEKSATDLKPSSAEKRTEHLAKFETEDQKLTAALSQLHNKKQDVSRKLTLTDQRVKRSKKSALLKTTLRLANIVNSASIVFATLNSSGHEVLSHVCAPFDAVILDEAAQSIEPDVLIPLVGANRSLKSLVNRCILVGDPKQLPATVLSNDPLVVSGLGQSLFERLHKAKYSKVYFLQTQYRMHPLISHFPSQHFYGGRLRDGHSVTEAKYWRPYHFDDAARFGPVTLLDTSGLADASEERSASGSMANLGEARVICALLSTIFRLYPSESLGMGKVAILTPYKRQVAFLRRDIGCNPILARANIEVSTVDGIQGREKDFVVLSTVRNGSGSGSIGFVKDERRMNVALTRARLALIVVGSADSLAQGSSHWDAFVRHCRSLDRVRRVQNTSNLFPEAYARVGVNFRPAELPPFDMLPTVAPRENAEEGASAEALPELSDRDSDLDDVEETRAPPRRRRGGLATPRSSFVRALPTPARPSSSSLDFDTSQPLRTLGALDRSASTAGRVPPTAPQRLRALLPSERVASMPTLDSPAALAPSGPMRQRPTERQRMSEPLPMSTVTAQAERPTPGTAEAPVVRVSVERRHVHPQAPPNLAASQSGLVERLPSPCPRKRPPAPDLVPPPPLKRARASATPSIAERDSQRLSAIRSATRNVARPAPTPPLQVTRGAPMKSSEVRGGTGLASRPSDASTRTAAQRALPSQVERGSSGRTLSSVAAAKQKLPPKNSAGFSLLASSKALDKTADARRRATGGKKD